MAASHVFFPSSLALGKPRRVGTETLWKRLGQELRLPALRQHNLPGFEEATFTVYHLAPLKPPADHSPGQHCAGSLGRD